MQLVDYVYKVPVQTFHTYILYTSNLVAYLNSKQLGKPTATSFILSCISKGIKILKENHQVWINIWPTRKFHGIQISCQDFDDWNKSFSLINNINWYWVITEGIKQFFPMLRKLDFERELQFKKVDKEI